MDVFKKHIGEIFDGRYKILRTIGLGGMAIVYEAIDLVTNRHVALKMLKDSISDNPQALRRFINECKAVSSLDHEKIVKILGVSVQHEHKFIVMEYIEGITLREYMNQHLEMHKSPLKWREALEFISQILQALNHAHMKGIVHRDIKPQNIMVMEQGNIKVTDFGIAKLPDAETVTMADHAIGTIYYISPEQAQGQKIDARSDIYSLGVMLYEMITGRLPFMAENSYGIMHKHINEAPLPPQELCPSLPLGVQQIILCAMEKKPENRYQSAPQMLRNIASIQRNPTMIFQPQKPTLKTPTSEVVIKKTTKEPEQYKDTKSKPPSYVRTPAPKKEPVQEVKEQPTVRKKRQSREVVPLSVVIMLLVFFLLIALFGFLVLFYVLTQEGKLAEPIRLAEQIKDTFSSEFSTGLWKSLWDKGISL